MSGQPERVSGFVCQLGWAPLPGQRELTGPGRVGGSPTVRGNRINRNGGPAMYVHDRARGVVEDNNLTRNGKGAWFIEDSKSIVTRARNKMDRRLRSRL